MFLVVNYHTSQHNETFFSLKGIDTR